MSQRKDIFDLVTVFVSFVLLAGLTRPFASAVNRVWVDEGLIYQLTVILGSPFGGNLDVPVLLVCGLLAGWLLLFCLDGTKRIQALFIVIGVGVPFALFLGETGRLINAVVDTPWAAVAGGVGGIATGVLSSLRFYGTKRPHDLSVLEKVRWLQFPAASSGVLYGMVGIVLVVVVDYTVFVSGGVSSLFVATTGFVLVGSLSVFMRYDQRRNIVMVSPPDFEGIEKYQPYVVGGLCERAMTDRHGFPIEGDSELNKAQTAGDMNALSVRFTSTVAFGFASSIFGRISPIPRWIQKNWFLQTVIIRSDGWTTNQIGIDSVNTEPDEHVLKYSIRLIRNYIRLPALLRKSFGGTYSSVIDRIEHADAILLVGPTPADGEQLPAGTDTLVTLCERYAGRAGTDVVLSTTRAGPVADDEQLAIDSPVFKQTIAVHRLGMDTETYRQCEIIPVDRFNAPSSSGFDDLLDEISN